MKRPRCPRCDGPLSEGRHRMSTSDAQAYPHAHCPKCGGGADEGWPVCVANQTGYYQCSCGISWSVALPTA